MATNFNPGDIVQLKSGGPAMTISEVKKNYGVPTGKYDCIWFKGASKEFGNFDGEVLKPYVAPKK